MMNERFLEKIAFDGLRGCWNWVAAIDRGYGQYSVGGRRQRAHRVAYEMHRGPIPDGLQLDHLCRNKRCVNPDHLEAVTGAENVRRAHAHNLCAKGHDLSPDNLRHRADGKRECLTCHREYHRTYMKRRRSRSAS